MLALILISRCQGRVTSVHTGVLDYMSAYLPTYPRTYTADSPLCIHFPNPLPVWFIVDTPVSTENPDTYALVAAQVYARLREI